MKTATSIALFSLAAIAAAGPITRRSYWPTDKKTDDADPSIIYSLAEWTHLVNQGSIADNGTLSYSKSSDASYSFSAFDYTHLNLTIYAGKKNDRGSFDVYLGDNKIGSGSAYDANASDQTEPQVVFQTTDLDTSANNTITVKNTQGDGPTLVLDYIYQEYEDGPP